VKIYTKTGDKGNTRLLGGTIVPKDDSRVEAYGTVDELISWLGVVSSQKLTRHDKDILLQIQNKLMLLCSHLADEKRTLTDLPMLEENDILALEQEIDKIDKLLPPLTLFIIPGGHSMVTFCHLARSVCRRAERRLVPLLKERQELNVAMKFLNRLSDYLFMLCRKIGQENNVKEITWKPKF
jgi:cob(I)alamin adenosyltransferase